MSQTTDPIPCIPTLSASVGIITSIQDVTAYVIRHTTAQPGKDTDLYPGIKLSLRELQAQYGDNPDALCSAYQNQLGDILTRYFPNGNIRVEVTSTEKETDGSYNLEVRVTVTDSSNVDSLVLTDAMIKVNQNSILELSLKGTKI
jgi:hypothetical protein